ncbi:MAG: Asp-tRNA(Asn)/Glu-tRNA(Gln) amidotransferase subunit GatB [Gemmatimonadetes bacterium]|nr:Asp-tRNA(Asn)/Glu-tRNA(Gln) amidotransferase subunit GatB [Gemmatimonadota bacterium]
MSWETVVGLEVHVQLKTRSKIFCACPTTFGDPPNTNVCPVCLGLPGALPVPNREVLRLAVRAALALGFAVERDTSVFARKNYFYPDLPKGYQITQFDRPLALLGSLEILSPERGRVAIGITRLHLEEDAGKSFHDRVPGMTAVDFNRSGVPLVEIVSEPDLRSPAEARAYLVALKQVLEYAEVSDCNMEEGSLRVDANLSVRRPGAALGTKQEVKNMNSFATVERALILLRDRQIATLESNAPVALTTFSAATGELRAMRTKEESHDYRYFPEPDLTPVSVSQAGIDVVAERNRLPELPAAKRLRLARDYGLSDYDAAVLSGTRALAEYYEVVVGSGAQPKVAANWVLGSVLADANEHQGRFRVLPARLHELIRMVEQGTVSHQAAKRVFGEIAEQDAPPANVAQRLGLVQIGDAGQLDGWITTVLQSHPGEVRRYRQGEAKLLAFFMGAVMKESGGRADPKRVQSVLRERLSGQAADR